MKRVGTRSRAALMVVAVSLLTLSLAPAALAKITPTRDAVAVAKALADRPSVVTGASFVAIPEGGNPVAISDTPIGEFPTSGDTYAILSTGDATLAGNANDSPGTGIENNPAGATPFRGTRDTVVLKVDLDVPKNVSCLSVRFRFYSEEFPEWVDDQFNDAFILELDNNSWSGSGATPQIVAPDNFAADTRGNPVSINGIGDASVAPGLSSDTTYDAGTRRLRASTPITPGLHSLYITVFDQGDRIFDSTVFIDRLQLSNLSSCVPGAAADLSQARPAGTMTLPNGKVSIPIGSVFAPARLLIDDVKFNPKKLDSLDPFTMKIRVRDTRGFLVRGALVKVRAIPARRLVATPEVKTNKRGIATIKFRPRALPLARGGLLTLFVRARKEGATKLGSVTGRRLVAVRVVAARS